MTTGDFNHDGAIAIAASTWLSTNIGIILGVPGNNGGTLQTSGTLNIADTEAGQSSLIARSSIAGNYLTDAFTVPSMDGSATQDVVVTLIGVMG